MPSQVGEGGTYGVGRDVREVGGNTWSVHNIIECELVDEGTELEEQGQRLRRVRVTVSIGMASSGKTTS